jgi:hypothetical protein
MSASQEFFTLERKQAEFEHEIRQAIFFGRTSDVVCPRRLDRITQAAIERIAAEFPNVTFETVLAAREEFQHQIDGTLSEARAIQREEMKRIFAELGYTD